jgi:hypothetical protein
MSEELICPDCGGVIGGDSTDAGRACTCWVESTRGSDVGSTPTTGGDTVVEQAAAPIAKVCCQCGKDLAGKRRLRDSRGYWCYACHKLDQEANKPKGKKCTDCGRVVPEAALTDVDGQMICSRCQAARKQEEKERRRLSPVETTAHDELAKKRLLWMFAVVAVLALIIILKQLKVIGH